MEFKLLRFMRCTVVTLMKYICYITFVSLNKESIENVSQLISQYIYIYILYTYIYIYTEYVLCTFQEVSNSVCTHIMQCGMKNVCIARA